MRVVGSKTTDSLPATRTDRLLSLFDPSSGLARRLNKRLDSVRFHYISLYVCAESSFVYGNNRAKDYNRGFGIIRHNSPKVATNDLYTYESKLFMRTIDNF